MDIRLGQRVSYSNFGVCEISCIEMRDDVCNPGQQVEYFTLTPMNPRLGKAFVPRSRLDCLRPALDREGAAALLARIPEVEPDQYTDKNHRAIEEHFQRMLRSGGVEDVVCVLKSMRLRIADLRAAGRNPSSSYLRLESDARSRLESELAYALEIPCCEVACYIESRLGGDAPN